MRITTLSRLYDDQGRLLYVDFSGVPFQRFTELAKGEPPWWIEVASITLTHYEDRQEAFKAALAAKSEGPVYV